MNWLPFWLGIGILFYFALPVEPSFWWPLGAGILFVVSLLYLPQKRYSFLFLVVLLGFVAALWQTSRVSTPFLEKPYFAIPLAGTVVDIEPKGKRHSLILGNLSSPRIPSEATPRRVKVSAALKDMELREGDRIQLRVTLIPPSPPVMEGAFDFVRYFYFRSIGAVGYAMPPAEILERRQEYGFVQRMRGRIGDLRLSIQQDLLRTLPQPASGIAIALVTGSMDSVQDEANQALRNSNLSHMLSISGMHMVIVCGFIFFLVRLLLVVIPYAHHSIDPKRWAAFAALLSGAFYLVLADAPVPAVRAYVMIAIYLSAILIHREADALRSLCLAATGILLVQPSTLMEPSFQLSFAATLALILAFRAIEPLYHREEVSGRGLPQQVIAYIAASGFSSLVAGLATTAFTIYHFNQFVIYGVLANILAAPLLSFVITPALLVLLILPWQWAQHGAACAANWGLNLLVEIGSWVSQLPMAYIYMPPVPGWTLGFLVLAIAIAIFLPRWWKLVAVPMTIPFILLPFSFSIPDMLIARDAKALAVRDGERWILLGGTQRHFTVSLWQQRLGMEFVERKRVKDALPPFLQCQEYDCRMQMQGKTYFIGNVPPEDCTGVDGFIEFILKRQKPKIENGKRVYPPMNLHCKEVPVVIDFWKIVKEGPLVISAGDSLKIVTACDRADKRPWVFYCPRASSGKIKYPAFSSKASIPSSPHK